MRVVALAGALLLGCTVVAGSKAAVVLPPRGGVTARLTDCPGNCAKSNYINFIMQNQYGSSDGGKAATGDEGSEVAFLETGAPTVFPMQRPFNVKCTCAQAVNVPSNELFPMEIPFGKCAAEKVEVAMKDDGTGMSPGNVKTAIGNVLRIKWAKVMYHHFSDMSGRTEAAILGLPGGDIVEFINALDAMEEMLAEMMSNADCKNYLQSYLKTTSKISFYMSTDTTAVEAISAAMQLPDLDLRETPPDSERNLLLENLQKADWQGCQVLRNMMNVPENYNLNAQHGVGLPQCAVRAFFEILWDKQDDAGRKLRLVELENTANEAAVVKVKTSAACTDAGIQPLVVPRGNNVCDDSGCGKSMFVSHQAAAQVMREELATFFAEQDSRADSQRMLQIMNANGQIYENRAIEFLARSNKQLPVYEVTIA